MKSCITISLVPEARGGPFVLGHDLPKALEIAASLGFDAVEIFPPHAKALPENLDRMLRDSNLALAALGTGAAWVLHRWSLTAAEPAVRKKALAFVRDMIDAADALGASAILGSLQGRSSDLVHRGVALGYFADGLAELSEHAVSRGRALWLEPLNRYETDLLRTLDDALEMISVHALSGVQILGDLFHMQIEEVDMAAALRRAGTHLGHIHFADSNRRPVGDGHTPIGPILEALRDIGYDRFLSAEVLPLPDSLSAARQAIAAFRLATRCSLGEKNNK